MIVRRFLKRGTIGQFHELNNAINIEIKKFSGYLGTRLIEPTDPSKEFVTIFSFDTYENYCNWDQSEERKRWLIQIEELVEGKSFSEHINGFNHWFEPYQNGKVWPPNWRMILIAYLAIFPLAYFVPHLLLPWLPENEFLAQVISSGVITVLMGYVSLPLMVKIFKRWLP